MGVRNWTVQWTVQWGIANEQEGIKAFEEATGMKVRGSGLWPAPSGILGASPTVIEVKCPFRWRETTVEEAVQEKSFYLHRLPPEGGSSVLAPNTGAASHLWEDHLRTSPSGHPSSA